MDGQAVAVVHAVSGVGSIFHGNHCPEFPGTTPDEYIAQQYLLARSQQINPKVAASHVDFLHIHAELALPVPGLQLGKPDIFALDFPFVGIDIRYQSPIIGHIFTPRTHSLQLPRKRPICFYKYFMQLPLESMLGKCYPIFKQK